VPRGAGRFAGKATPDLTVIPDQDQAKHDRDQREDARAPAAAPEDQEQQDDTLMPSDQPVDPEHRDEERVSLHSGGSRAPEHHCTANDGRDAGNERQPGEPEAIAPKELVSARRRLDHDEPAAVDAALFRRSTRAVEMLAAPA
jgi:hypothetical protein